MRAKYSESLASQSRTRLCSSASCSRSWRSFSCSICSSFSQNSSSSASASFLLTCCSKSSSSSSEFPSCRVNNYWWRLDLMNHFFPKKQKFPEPQLWVHSRQWPRRRRPPSLGSRPHSPAGGSPGPWVCLSAVAPGDPALWLDSQVQMLPRLLLVCSGSSSHRAAGAVWLQVEVRSQCEIGRKKKNSSNGEGMLHTKETYLHNLCFCQKYPADPWHPRWRSETCAWAPFVWESDRPLTVAVWPEAGGSGGRVLALGRKPARQRSAARWQTGRSAAGWAARRWHTDPTYWGTPRGFHGEPNVALFLAISQSECICQCVLGQRKIAYSVKKKLLQSPLNAAN